MNNKFSFRRSENSDNDEQIAQLRKSARLNLFPEMSRQDSRTSSKSVIMKRGFEEMIHGKSISHAFEPFCLRV